MKQPKNQPHPTPAQAARDTIPYLILTIAFSLLLPFVLQKDDAHPITKLVFIANLVASAANLVAQVIDISERSNK